jgi:hypothetical protein
LWGGGDSFDREITAQFLYNPSQKGLQNPLMKKGGNVKTTSRSKRKPRQPKVSRIQFEEETYEYGKGGDIATNLSIAQTRKIANETAKALGSEFKVTRSSVDVASFDLDFQGQYTEGGSYVIHSNGDVVNYGLPNKPVYYNYKTKKKYAKGGDIASMMRNRRGK